MAPEKWWSFHWKNNEGVSEFFQNIQVIFHIANIHKIIWLTLSFDEEVGSIGISTLFFSFIIIHIIQHTRYFISAFISKHPPYHFILVIFYCISTHFYTPIMTLSICKTKISTPELSPKDGKVSVTLQLFNSLHTCLTIFYIYLYICYVAHWHRTYDHIRIIVTSAQELDTVIPTQDRCIPKVIPYGLE